MVQTIMEEWRSALVVSGEQFVMMGKIIFYTFHQTFPKPLLLIKESAIKL